MRTTFIRPICGKMGFCCMLNNKTAAKQWLEKSQHSLSAAEILFDADHYTDIIGQELQQAIEKMLKALLAASNSKIPKTHNLIELYELVSEDIQISDENLVLLARATKFYIEERYPIGGVYLPDKNEIVNI